MIKKKPTLKSDGTKTKTMSIKMVSVEGEGKIDYSINYEEYSNAQFIIIHPELGFNEKEWCDFAKKVASCYHDSSAIDYYSVAIPEDGIKIFREIDFGFGSAKIRTISIEKNKKNFADVLGWFGGGNSFIFFCEMGEKNTLKVTEIYNYCYEISNDIYKNLSKLDSKGYFVTFFEAQFCTP